MTTRKLISLLLGAVMLLALAACGGASLAGTWETELEMSVLGVGVTEPTTTMATVTFILNEDGTGTLSVDNGIHSPADDPFTYEAEGDALTLRFESGAVEEYTYTLNGDTLTLTGPRQTLELTRK